MTMTLNWGSATRRPAAWRFSCPGPLLPLCTSDGVFIARDGSSLRLLVRPIEAVHQPPDVIPVIAHPKLPVDHLGHARCGPQVGPVAVCQWSLKEHLQEPAPLRGPELGRAARGGAYSERLSPPSPPGLEPTHHRTGRTMDTPPDLIERQAGLQQRQCSPAPVCQQTSATLRSGHRSSLPFISIFTPAVSAGLPAVLGCMAPRFRRAGRPRQTPGA
jgi:hypothetical protein